MENKFELLHVGIKTDDPVKAEETAKLLAMMFNPVSYTHLRAHET